MHVRTHSSDVVVVDRTSTVGGWDCRPKRARARTRAGRTDGRTDGRYTIVETHASTTTLPSPLNEFLELDFEEFGTIEFDRERRDVDEETLF